MGTQVQCIQVSQNIAEQVLKQVQQVSLCQQVRYGTTWALAHGEKSGATLQEIPVAASEAVVRVNGSQHLISRIYKIIKIINLNFPGWYSHTPAQVVGLQFVLKSGASWGYYGGQTGVS